MGLGGLWWSSVLNSALPPQRLRPDTRPEHQDPVSTRSLFGRQGWALRETEDVEVCGWSLQSKVLSSSADFPANGSLASVSLSARVGGSPAESGVAVAHCWDKDTGSRSSGEVLLDVSPPRVCH